jgi:hypothetical protein
MVIEIGVCRMGTYHTSAFLHILKRNGDINDLEGRIDLLCLRLVISVVVKSILQ